MTTESSGCLILLLVCVFEISQKLPTFRHAPMCTSTARPEYNGHNGPRIGTRGPLLFEARNLFNGEHDDFFASYCTKIVMHA